MTNPCQSYVWPQHHPNGTIGCGNPHHHVSEPAPAGLPTEDRISWIADHMPPLSAEQRSKLALLLNPGGS
jgi:hypothetical protein